MVSGVLDATPSAQSALSFDDRHAGRLADDGSRN